MFTNTTASPRSSSVSLPFISHFTISTVATLIGTMMTKVLTLDGDYLTGWASINSLALLYNVKDAAIFYSSCWNTGINSDLTFASIGPYTCLPNKHVSIQFNFICNQGITFESYY